MDEVIEKFLTIKDIGEILQVSEKTAYRLVSDEMDFHKVGGQIRVSREEFNSYMERNKNEANPNN